MKIKSLTLTHKSVIPAIARGATSIVSTATPFVKSIEAGNQEGIPGYWIDTRHGLGFMPASCVSFAAVAKQPPALKAPKPALAPTLPAPPDEEGAEDPAPPLPPALEGPKSTDLASQSVKDLRKMAAKLGISSDGLRKEALVAAIAEAQG